MSESWYFLLLAAASALLVGAVRRVAIARGVIDHPTERGSHRVPTPRGGGLGIVAVVAAAFVARAVRAGDTPVLVATAAMVVVAAIGWLDDRRGLPVRDRLAVHLLGGVAVAALWARGAEAEAGTLTVLLIAWWIFWTVSCINLVNFMDGINGLVASQIAIFAASLMLFGGESVDASWYAAAVAAACVGFLPWNFPHARIFLGDVGSGSLGMLVPVLAVLAMRDGRVDFVRAHLPLLPLLSDAVVTILRRWRRGEALTQPHRSHLYQRMANGGSGHTRVTLLYGAAGVCGAIVAHASGGSRGLPLIVGYVIGVALLGAALDRRVGSVTPR
jgi:UDP-N-acetylmuramyl pentapeptide phosphotransferase/UDP-N-acetylglucosamine-1-phosphate transferase